MSLVGLAAHGLPAGFEEGCRSAGGCPNHGTELLVCRDAWMRYRSDYSFKKRVDRGLTCAEILAEERAELEASRPVVVAAKRRDAVRAERARLVAGDRERVRAEKAVAREASRQLKRDALRRSEPLKGADVVLPSDPFDRAVAVWEAAREAKRVAVAQCRKDLRSASRELSAAQEALREAHEVFVAAEAAVVVAEGMEVSRKPYKPRSVPAKVKSEHLPRVAREAKPRRASRELKPHGTNAAWTRGCRCEACVEGHLRYHRDYWRKRRAAAVPAEHHGTAYGYGLGCHVREACPASPTCADASLAEERRRRREAGIPEKVETVDAGPVREHIVSLMGSGVALLTIAERAQVSKSVLKNLMYGRSGDRRGEKSLSLSVVNAERILAVRSGNPREKEL